MLKVYQKLFWNVIKKNNKLKIRVISEGYDSELNVRFPRDLREEGALYSVETIEKNKRELLFSQRKYH